MTKQTFTLKRGARAWLLAGAMSLATPAVTWAENLADALVGAYEYSRILEQNRALLRAADEDVAIALAALRPVLDFAISVTRDVTETTSVSVTPRAPG